VAEAGVQSLALWEEDLEPDERARRMIAIAAPEHRDALSEQLRGSAG